MSLIWHNSLGNLCRIQAEFLNYFSHGQPSRILCLQQMTNSSDHSAAADERYAEPNSFFLREPNHLDGERQLGTLKSLKQRHRHHNTEDSVIAPGVRHRVEVRTDQKPWRLIRAGWIKRSEIACCIDFRSRTKGLYPTRNRPMDIVHRR